MSATLPSSCTSPPSSTATRVQTDDARQAEIVEAAEILIKYKGYIERERLVADKMHRFIRNYQMRVMLMQCGDFHQHMVMVMV